MMTADENATTFNTCVTVLYYYYNLKMLCIKDNFLKLYDAFHAVLPICVAGPDCRKGSN